MFDTSICYYCIRLLNMKKSTCSLVQNLVSPFYGSSIQMIYYLPWRTNLLIFQFLAESLDVVNDTEWVISLGDAFARQYDLYAISDGHAALLHRCNLNFYAILGYFFHTVCFTT